MTLSAAQLAARAGRVTASFIPYLMSADEARITDKWRELTGDPEWRDEREINLWLSHYGTVMEKIMLDWREQKTGHPVTRRGDVVLHPEHPWASCTLDGLSAQEDAVLQCKTAHRWRNVDQLAPFYSWQVLYEAGILRAKQAILYISDGGLEPKDYEVTRDPEAEAMMWARAAEFNACVESLTPPIVAAATTAPPIKAERVIDMEGNNRWADAAARWQDTLKAHNDNLAAAKEIKALVPPDAARASGYGVTVWRNKSNHLSLKVSK